MYSQFPYKIPKLKKVMVLDNQISDSETKGKGIEMSVIQVLEALHQFLISILMRTTCRIGMRRYPKVGYPSDGFVTDKLSEAAHLIFSSFLFSGK